ncbi:MAG: methyltransferase domain-containing protein [Melioribacteraceae bacterium]|nr:methyltransferase domain-containing protein [Melioribacteraceae bacterium]MCF8262866.1 methyltransferase domain-containing protein [Melioribacteraceae bacterium]MCF8430906.1 methyltransferase domain-containing protein [Melioribacteraceae bacterium]
MENKIFAQFGCGYSNPTGWINYDSSPTLRLEKLPLIGMFLTKNESRFPEGILYGDIVKGLPLPENSCDGLYSSHVLEHLAYEDLKTALKNSYKVLKPNGIFRMVLPDLETLATAYVESNEEIASHKFMRHTILGVEKRSRGLKNLIIELFGNSRHLWMWDYKGLSLELKNAGFRNIRKAKFNDSSEAMFKKVEDVDRFENALAIECIK